MASNNSAPLLTSSQEDMILTDLQDTLGHFDIFGTPEPLEVKYDISEHLPVSHQQQQQVTILPDNQLQVQMPTNEEFAGQLNFHLVPDQQDDTKSWVYSQRLKKVFIEIEKTLPVRIKWSPPCDGLFIKAGMAFCQPTYRSEPVTRCHNHAISKPPILEQRHVLSCKHTDAVYHEMKGHHSVRVPLGAPQPGSDSIQMDFMFHCKNSCSTGINRRLTEVVFNLEDEAGTVLGRRKLLVRICSCPKRDREKEEKPVREHSAPKRRKIAAGKKCIPIYREPEPEIFTFSARIYGRENYEALKRIAYGLMAETMDRNGQQAIIKPLMDELNRMR